MDLLLEFLMYAVALVCFIITPTVKGSRAQHSIFLIKRPEGPINRDGSVTAYAHVQEVGEYRLFWILAVAFSALAHAGAYLIEVNPAAIPFVPLIAVPLGQLIFRKGFGNFVDFAGHGAEIIAAEEAEYPDQDGISYREAEIARMKTNRDKKGLDVGAILDDREWLARIVYWLGS